MRFPRTGTTLVAEGDITWRQQVGGSAIEASKIAGHSDLEMSGEYTFVTPERQNELTRRIQRKLAQTTKAASSEGPDTGTAPVRTSVHEEPLATTRLQ